MIGDDRTTGEPDVERTLRAIVDRAPAIGLEEVVERTPSSSRPRRTTYRVLAAALVLVLIGAAVLGWSRRGGPELPFAGGGSSPTTLLPIPEAPTGPIPAANTGGPDPSTDTDFPSEGWTIARTGADDRQLVVYFGGGGCPYTAAVVSQPDVVEVKVRAAPPSGICPTSYNSIALGVALPEPLAGRPVSDGTAIRPVIDGRELATLDWPGDGARPSGEYLVSAPNPDELGPSATYEGHWTWTTSGPPPPQAPDDTTCEGDPSTGVCTHVAPSDEERWSRQPLTLRQEHWGAASSTLDGLSPLSGWCPSLDTTMVEVGGTPAKLDRCSNGPMALTWNRGEDRFSLTVPDPVARAIDADALVALAGDVRLGS